MLHSRELHLTGGQQNRFHATVSPSDCAARRLTPGFQRYVAVLCIRFRKRFRVNRVRTAVRKRRCRTSLPFTKEKANRRVELS